MQASPLLNTELPVTGQHEDLFTPVMEPVQTTMEGEPGGGRRSVWLPYMPMFRER